MPLDRDPPTPGYHPEGMYELKVDLDADVIEDTALSQGIMSASFLGS